MMIDIKFGIGDKVQFQYSEKVVTECGFCGGAGKITGLDETEIRCPICYGSGQIVNVQSINPDLAILEGTIKEILIDWRDNPNEVYKVYFKMEEEDYKDLLIDQDEVYGIVYN